MGNERIKFGKHPDTYTQGLARLTPKDDPRIKHDKILETLSYLRESLESVDIEKLSLPERMTKLNREEIELLEENGFKRGKKLFGSDWTFPDIGSDWADLYNINTGNYDDKYSFWGVTEMIPSYPDQRRYKLICIYTHQEFGKELAKNRENEQFYLGLVTRNELKELKKTLQRFTDFED